MCRSITIHTKSSTPLTMHIHIHPNPCPACRPPKTYSSLLRWPDWSCPDYSATAPWPLAWKNGVSSFWRKGTLETKKKTACNLKKWMGLDWWCGWVIKISLKRTYPDIKWMGLDDYFPITGCPPFCFRCELFVSGEGMFLYGNLKVPPQMTGNPPRNSQASLKG